MPPIETDAQGRLRDKTIAFRVSPEEDACISRLAKLAGMTTQQYICARCEERNVVVNGNPRVYKALREEMKGIRDELALLSSVADVDADMWERLGVIARIMKGLKDGGETLDP